MAITTLDGSFTIKQIIDRNYLIQMSALRWWLVNRESNGLEATGAVERLGAKKIIINEAKLVEWLTSSVELNRPAVLYR